MKGNSYMLLFHSLMMKVLIYEGKIQTYLDKLDLWKVEEEDDNSLIFKREYEENNKS